MRRSSASSLSCIGVVSSTGFALLNQLKMASSPSQNARWSFILFSPPLAPPSLHPSRVPLCGALREEFCCWGCGHVDNTTGCGFVFLEEGGARGGRNLLQDGNWWPVAGYLTAETGKIDLCDERRGQLRGRR